MTLHGIWSLEQIPGGLAAIGQQESPMKTHSLNTMFGHKLLVPGRSLQSKPQLMAFVCL